MLTSSWTSGGSVVTVETIWDGSETDAEMAARHHTAVLAELALYPIEQVEEN